MAFIHASRLLQYQGKLIMMTSELIKQTAYDLDADLCGIASVDRFEQAPAGYHPRDIFPEVRSIIVVAKRCPESPFQANQDIPFSIMNDVLITQCITLICDLSITLEKRFDLLAVPVPSEPYEFWDEDNRRGQGILSLRHAAVLAGLGTLGKNTLLVNPQYGNRLSLGVVLVNIDLEADPLMESQCPLNCTRCIDACPVGALDGTRVNQQLCRSHSGRQTARGQGLTTCRICRTVCPNGQGVTQAGSP